MLMGKVKNQHYVPRSYLKYFSNNKEQVWVYDKVINKFFNTNIANVAAEKYFYDIPFEEIYNILPQKDREKINDIMKEGNFASIQELEKSGKQIIEKFFAENIEGMFEKALNKIRVSFNMMSSPFYSQVLSKKDRIQLSLMLALQIVRSKEFRESHSESIQSITQAIVDVIASSHEDEYELGSITAKAQYEFESLEHADIILSDFPIRLAEILSSHIWFVGVNQTKLPFYTSDDPVVKRAHKHHPFLGTDGYGSPGIEIALPLSDQLILVLVEREYHSLLSFWENRFIPLTNKQNIIYYNSLQVYQSNRQIYCSKRSFKLINEMKRTEGSLERKPRKMVVNSFLGKNIY